MRSFLYSLYITLLLLLSCGGSGIAGGSTDTELGSAALSGHIFSRSDKPSPKATVILFEQDFNPIQNSPVPQEYVTSSDDEGYYKYDSLEAAEMNMVIRSSDRTELLFKESLTITGDSLYLGMDTLITFGAAKIALPESFDDDTLDLLNGYIFVFGSDLFVRLSEERIISDKGKQYVIFDTLPAQKIPAFHYAEEYNPSPPLLLHESITIISGDTVQIDN